MDCSVSLIELMGKFPFGEIFFLHRFFSATFKDPCQLRWCKFIIKKWQRIISDHHLNIKNCQVRLPEWLIRVLLNSYAIYFVISENSHLEERPRIHQEQQAKTKVSLQADRKVVCLYLRRKGHKRRKKWKAKWKIHSGFNNMKNIYKVVGFFPRHFLLFATFELACKI